MTNEKMLEMMEFFEMYEMFKAMKSKTPESARTSAVAMQQTNTVDTFFDNANLVQRQEQVIDLGKSTSKDVETKFELHEQIDVNGKKYYCIKSEMCTWSYVRDSNKQVIYNEWGKPKKRYFNQAAYKIAKDIIKSVDGIITIEVPFKDKTGKIIQYKKPWFAWGFTTEKKALEAIKNLPKVVKAEEINKVNAQ